MTSFAHTGSTFDKVFEACYNYADFNALFTGANCAYILFIAAEKLNFENFNDAFRAYRKYFQTLFPHEICRIKSFIHWRKLRINIAYSSGEIKLWNLYWRHSHIPEVLSKSCLSMKYAELSPLFTGTNSAYILLIAAEKLNFENFNDVIRAYRKYFWKNCWRWYMQN